MEILEIALNIVLIICSILIIVIVLAQKTSSGGLGAAFGGESPSISPRAKSANREVKLQRITTVLAIILAVLAIALLIVSQLKPAEAGEDDATPTPTIAPATTPSNEPEGTPAQSFADLYIR